MTQIGIHPESGGFGLLECQTSGSSCTTGAASTGVLDQGNTESGTLRRSVIPLAKGCLWMTFGRVLVASGCSRK